MWGRIPRIVVDLVAGGADHRANDPVHQARTELANLPVTIARGGRLHDDPNADPGTVGDGEALATFIARLEESDVHDAGQRVEGQPARVISLRVLDPADPWPTT